MQEHTTLKQIVEQLESCKFTDEIGHPIENNVAFMVLKQRAEKESALDLEWLDLLEQAAERLHENWHFTLSRKLQEKANIEHAKPEENANA